MKPIKSSDEGEELYVCVTPVKVTKDKEVFFEESTIVALEKDLVVVKDRSKKVK